MLKLGPFKHESRVIVAPMAGVTDLPFRNICRSLGAYWMVSEMVTSQRELWASPKSLDRLPHESEGEPRWVQIVGADPVAMAEAAKMNVDMGACIIDINMGCPAKKVCRKLAGSALLRDEKLVTNILTTVVGAVDVPVTLKMRLGWSPDEVNATNIAHIAEDVGVQLLTVHGRTRACRFSGTVNYEAVGEVKDSVTIPVIVNGDITSAKQAKSLVENYGFDGVMIGRAVQGRPWLAAQISACLSGTDQPTEPGPEELIELLTIHLRSLSKFYGENRGVRIARKHLGWYLKNLPGGHQLIREFCQLNCLDTQIAYVQCEVFEQVREAGLEAA